MAQIGVGVNPTGLFVPMTGDVIISGVKTFTGNPQIPAPTLPSGAVNLSYLSGVSGVIVAQIGGGGVNPTGLFVPMTGDVLISGVKTFTGNPQIPAPTLPSGAVNLSYLSGVSGVLAQAAGGVTNNYYITGTGLVSASSNASGNITNSFSITSGTTNVYNSGVNTNTFTASGTTTVINSGAATNTFNGAVTSYININQPTGNFVNMSFYFDEYNLVTGLNLIEGFVSRDFTFTGYGLGVWQSGYNGLISGSLYQRNSINTKTRFLDFYLNSGVVWYASGGYNQVISGLNRVGVDIYRLSSGVTGLTVGAFGVGY